MTRKRQGESTNGQEVSEEFLQELAKSGASPDFVQKLREGEEPARRSSAARWLTSPFLRIGILGALLALILLGVAWALAIGALGAAMAAIDLWLDQRFDNDPPSDSSVG